MEKGSTTLVEKASQRIIEYIVCHKLLPGSRLPTETEYMGMLRVSRGTLREAFRSLAARNILEIRQGSGTFVSSKMGIPDDPLGLSFLYDEQSLLLNLLDVRLMLEPKMAEMAATNATMEQKEELFQQVEELESCTQCNGHYAQADYDFHCLIAAASGNPVLGNLVRILHQSIRENTNTSLWAQCKGSILKYYRQILVAIQKRDILGARYFMTMYLLFLRESMQRGREPIPNCCVNLA